MSIKTFLLPAVSLMTLGGCGAITSGGVLSAESNPSLYSVHQPVVQQRGDTIDLSAPDGLAAGEADRLAAWLDTMAARPGDQLTLAAPGDAARYAVAEVAVRRGLSVYAAPVDGSMAPGVARLSLSRVTASVPGCPDWSNAGQFGAPISTDTNHGCATASNLAAMVADPNDLLRGRSAGQMVSGDDAARAVKTYRERTQTGIRDYKSGQGPVLELPIDDEGEDE